MRASYSYKAWSLGTNCAFLFFSLETVWGCVKMQRVKIEGWGGNQPSCEIGLGFP